MLKFNGSEFKLQYPCFNVSKKLKMYTIYIVLYYTILKYISIERAAKIDQNQEYVM